MKFHFQLVSARCCGDTPFSLKIDNPHLCTHSIITLRHRNRVGCVITSALICKHGTPNERSTSALTEFWPSSPPFVKQEPRAFSAFSTAFENVAPPSASDRRTRNKRRGGAISYACRRIPATAPTTYLRMEEGGQLSLARTACPGESTPRRVRRLPGSRATAPLTILCTAEEGRLSPAPTAYRAATSPCGGKPRQGRPEGGIPAVE